jgi:hypothetical protein
MKTLNSIFVERRLATPSSSITQSCDIELAAGSKEWLGRLNYLRSICFVPGEDPFQTNQESSATVKR